MTVRFVARPAPVRAALAPARTALVLLVLALAALPAALAPAAAQAGGFTQPVAISGVDNATAPQIAIAPNGRTAVMYVRNARHGAGTPHDEYRVAIGPSPDHLGPFVTLPASRNFASANTTDRLFARPDGGFGVCFATFAAKTRMDGCSLAPPTGGFGRRFVTRMLRGQVGTVSTAVLPDSSIFLLLTRSTYSKKGALVASATSWRTLSPLGQLSAEQAVSRTDDTLVFADDTRVAVAADGSVAIPAEIPVPGKKTDSHPGIRIKPAGADAFGAAIPVSSELMIDSVAVSAAGAGFVSQFDTYKGNPCCDYPPYDQRFVSVPTTGVVGPTLALPGPQGSGTDGSVLALPGATTDLFALTSATATGSNDQDCFNRVSGSVATGSLAALGHATTATRISRAGQIAVDPQAAALADGTVVASWGDAVARSSDSRRLEIAIRAPGAASFAASQVLPNYYDGYEADGGRGKPVLGAAADQAALVWPTTAPHGRTRIVMSVLHAAPPYATQSTLPKHPGEPCPE